MKKLLYTLIGILAVCLIAYMVILNMPKANTKNMSSAVSINAKALFSEFTDNEKTANKKYNGKIIDVTGNVVKVITDKKGSTVVILDSGDAIGGILCTLQKSPKTKPKIGSKVKIKGQCSGLLMDVVLNKCHIIS